jgi:L-ascorbate metabolism protein UlaG (beta-lactamase superfamily)
MNDSTTFRWLGAAGIELNLNGQVLVVDPYLTRFPAWKLWWARIVPDRARIAEQVRRCDFVLVTHAHFDHITDVPDLIRHTGATGFGSANSCRLLAACGVPRNKIRQIGAGDRLAMGGFQVEVRGAAHMGIPGFGSGPLGAGLKPPLRARDYRMDDCWSFLITVDGLRLLTDPGRHTGDAAPADVLLVYPGLEVSYYEALLSVVRPQVVVPIHWDDLFQPLSDPIRPYWQPPSWAFPPLRRINLVEFRQRIERTVPGMRVLAPEAFCDYDLGELQ